MGMGALLILRLQHLARFTRSIIGTAIDVLIVEAYGQTVAFKEIETLIEAHASQCIFRTEIARLRLFSFAVAVVNLMEAEVIIYADAAACTVIMVLHAQSHGPARNPLVTFIDGSIHRSGIRGVETCQIPVEESIPMFVEIITELQVTAILLKTHTGAMVVTTSVLGSNRAGEIPRTHLIGDFSLNRSP